MNIIKVGLLVSVCIVLSSCTFTIYVQGTVIDSETQLPVGNVVIKILEDPRSDSIEYVDQLPRTDSIGRFEIFSPTAGLFVCPKITLSFEKEKYNKVIKKYRNWNDNVVIVLEKLKE